MQLSKRSHIVLSITVIFVVFTSVFYFTTRATPDGKPQAEPFQASIISPDLYIGKVYRLNQVNRYGYNVITDELTFVNNGSVPVTHVYYTINQTYLSYFMGFTARSDYESSLSFQEAQNSLFGYKTYIVYLNEPILPKTNHTINVITTFNGLYTAKFNQSTTNQMVYFNFSKFPFSPYPMYDVFSDNAFPYRTFFDNYTEPAKTDGVKVQYEASALAPFSEEIFHVEAHNNQYSFMEFTEVVRNVYLNPWGYIRVVENHQLKNTGDIYVTQFDYRLPELAYNVSMYDNIGTITRGTLEEDSHLFKIVLENRAGINPGATKKYTLEYYLPLDEFFSRSYRQASLKMNIILTDYAVLIKNQHTYLRLYAGKSIISTSITPNAISYESSSMVLYFYHTNIIPTNDFYLFLEYKESGFQMVGRGLLFTALSLIAFSMYAVVRTRTKSLSEDEAMIREAVIPEQEMREFISYYEEITAIRIDIKNLESDLSRKKIAKKAYSKQLKMLESKLKTSQEDIKPFKKLILNIGGPIADIVKRLDLREAELISNQDSIKLYDDRYKKGKLPSKQAYNTLRQQMVDNGEKIQRQIDRLINQMKTYLI